MEIMGDPKTKIMKDENKTKKQLIKELEHLRKQIIELETKDKRSEKKSPVSEEHLNILFEKSTDGFFLSDLKGTLIDGNKAAQKIVGYTKEELVGKNFLKLDLLSPKQIQKAASLLAKNTLGLATGPDEFILNRKNGTQVPVEIRTFPIKFKGKTIVLGIARDISVRKHALNELKESEKKFREMADLLPQTVFELDLEGNVTYSNRCGFETFGYTHKDLERGISALQLFIPKERDRIKQNIQKKLAGMDFEDHEYTALKKDSSTFPVLIYSSPIIRNNKPAGLRGLILDISERKLTEEILRRAREELELKVHERTAELQKLNEALLSDITERKLIERALRESEDKFKQMSENISEIFWMTEPKSAKILYISPAYEAIWQHPIEDLYKNPKKWMEYIHQDDHKIVMANWEKQIQGHSTYEEFRIILHDGSIRWIANKSYPITSGDKGEVYYVTGVAEDITSRKLAADQIRYLNRLKEDLLIPSSLDEKLRRITDGVVEIFHADFSRIWITKPGDLCDSGCIHATVMDGPHVCRNRVQCLHLLASSGRYTHIDGKVHRRVPFGCYKIGRVASGEYPKFITNDVTHDPSVHDHAWAKKLGLVSFAGYRLISAEGKPIGVLALFSKHVFSTNEDILLETLATTTAHVIQTAKTEDELRKSDYKYRALFEESKDVVYMSTLKGKFIDINPAGVELLGYSSKEELLQIDIIRDLYVHPSERKTFQNMLATKGYVKDYELEFKRKDGEHIIVLLTSTSVRDEGGKISAYRGIMRDITERKRLEQQLLQAQKMEAIGQLAGGVAHDFNNILTAIIGYGNLLKTELSQNELLSTYTAHILNSAERAANLTHNLLAFSRRQMINPMPVHVNNILNVLKSFLPRLIGEDIELSMLLSEKKLTVIADSSHIEQVLMNLATNARDAMPDGGRLTITTDQVELDEEFIMSHGYGNIGSYALISVEDTGHGMDRETKEKLFEPFFTTKEVGKGTGLGLSMVYGIIKQHNGYIDVEGEISKGTTFKIYLPLTESKEADKKPEGLPLLKKGTETILIAEDDIYVREFIKEILTEYGYKVLEAIDGKDAIRIFNAHMDTIQLIMLDVVMPKMDGKEVYNEIKKASPDTKVIFMSGYATDILYKKGIVEEGLIFISKPISPDELLFKVREVLDK
jgi:PAS domain S-box-containing protein